jgi:deoxyribose-phosphate aldolase
MPRVERLQNWQEDKRIEPPMQPMLKNFHFALVALALVGAGLAERAVAADPAQTVHGSADVYAAPGIALAWGILRGANEAATTVVVRVAADSQSFGRWKSWASILHAEDRAPARADCAQGHGRRQSAARAIRRLSAHRAPLLRVGVALGERRAEARRLLSWHPGHDAGVSLERRARESISPPASAARAKATVRESHRTLSDSRRARAPPRSFGAEAGGHGIRHRGRCRRRTHLADRLLLRPPCWVSLAARSLKGSAAQIASVVGFPHGGDRSDVKANAAALAVADGATEIDMVQNFGALKSGDTARVATDIEAVVRAVPGIAVKVILESAVLTDDEKNLACRLAVDAGAAFVKTSTGFHPSGGATVADVRLMRAAVGPVIGVKASGGIRSLDDARAMLEAGANRIGTSCERGDSRVARRAVSFAPGRLLPASRDARWSP